MLILSKNHMIFGLFSNQDTTDKIIWTSRFIWLVSELVLETSIFQLDDCLRDGLCMFLGKLAPFLQHCGQHENIKLCFAPGSGNIYNNLTNSN